MVGSRVDVRGAEERRQNEKVTLHCSKSRNSVFIFTLQFIVSFCCVVLRCWRREKGFSYFSGGCGGLVSTQSNCGNRERK